MVSAFASAIASCAPTFTLRARSSNRNGTNEALIVFLSSSRAAAAASRVARRARDHFVVAERRGLRHNQRSFVAPSRIGGERPERDFATAPRVAQRERDH